MTFDTCAREISLDGLQPLIRWSGFVIVQSTVRTEYDLSVIDMSNMSRTDFIGAQKTAAARNSARTYHIARRLLHVQTVLQYQSGRVIAKQRRDERC
jgi:hypothetical protein